MNDGLHDTLKALVLSGSVSNPALNALLHDYTKYHAVFLAVGGLFLVAFALLATFCWRRFRSTPKSGVRRWSFERVTYVCFGVSSMALALMLAAILAGNVTNVLRSRQGFSDAVGMVGVARDGTRTAELHQAFTSWLQSGRTATPPLIERRIDQRLAWQRPKALICSALLAVLGVLSARIWRSLIRRSRGWQARWQRKDVTLLVTGTLGASLCLLLMLMVIGNTQGSLAPMSLTLFYG